MALERVPADIRAEGGVARMVGMVGEYTYVQLTIAE